MACVREAFKGPKSALAQVKPCETYFGLKHEMDSGPKQISQQADCPV